MILRPGINFRRHDDEVNVPLEERYSITWDGSRCEIPTGINDLILRMQCDHPAEFIPNVETANVIFEMERNRGYPFEGSIHSPGYFVVPLTEGQEVTFTASTETSDVMDALMPVARP